MCACVGCDAFGAAAVKSLKDEGIDVCHIRTVERVSSGTAVIVVIDGDNRIILDRGANALLNEEDIRSALDGAKEGDVLLVQLENPASAAGYALKLGRDKGMYVVLNPAPADPEIAPYLGYCDLVIPNETEAEILGGREKLAAKVNHLIVTLGSDGFEYYRKGKAERYPCIPVKAVDTTAAGDTFCGGLCARLAMGEELIAAARYGAAAASLACTRRGAQPSIPSAEEVREFLLKYQK